MLKDKVAKSIQVIRQAYKQYQSNIAVAWTGGKDSTVMLHLIRTAFQGKIPFPVVFNDSTMEFEEIYKFINRISRLYNLNLQIVQHLPQDLATFYSLKTYETKEEFSRQMKINAINYAFKKHKYKGFMVGVRWDEHVARSKEQYFRQFDRQIRVHPILHFREEDIWEYIKEYNVPYICLYDQGYRSLGEAPFTRPATSSGSERSGRSQAKEEAMANLRKYGYW